MEPITLERKSGITPPLPKNFAADRKRFHDAVNPHTPALVLDVEGTIQHTTPAARRLLEYKPDQFVDSCFFTHVHGKNLYQVMRDVADMVCYGRASASWLLRLRTGQARWRWYKAVARNHLNHPESAIIVTLQDLYDW